MTAFIWSQKGVIYDKKLTEKILIRTGILDHRFSKIDYMYFISIAPKTLFDMRKDPATWFL